jgi:hypothetical protein
MQSESLRGGESVRFLIETRSHICEGAAVIKSASKELLKDATRWKQAGSDTE